MIKIGKVSNTFAYFVRKGKHPRNIEKMLKKIKFKADELNTDVFRAGNKKYIFIGIGSKKGDILRKAIAKALSIEGKITYIPNDLDIEEQIKLVVEGAVLYSLKFDEFKAKRDKKRYVLGLMVDRKFKKFINKVKVIAESQNYARRLAGLPPNIGTPEYMVKEARELAKKLGLSIKVFDKKALKRKGMNAILSVNAGSDKGAFIVHLTYKPEKPRIKVAIAGKGITFDAGGLDVKPARYMFNMHLDKTGACVALGVIRAVALLKMPVEVHVVIGLTENVIGSKAYKPNSIIKAYNGKTIEILHTDAEGRLVLADVLSYISKDIKPNYTFDFATLTGAMSISLGKYAIGAFSNDKCLSELAKKIGEKAGEKAWPFPMWEEYNEMLKSDFADVKNIGSWNGDAGSITAAKFLEHFVKGKWLHFDIASMMIAEKHPYYRTGPIAPGVRLLVNMLEVLENGCR